MLDHRFAGLPSYEECQCLDTGLAAYLLKWENAEALERVGFRGLRVIKG